MAARNRTLPAGAGTSLTLVLAAGCFIALTSFGVRSAFGLFTQPWSVDRGYGRDVFALAIAIQNLCWGVAQPFAGALADRLGPWRVLAGGGLLYGLGTALSALAHDPFTLYATAGILTGLGMGGASYVTVLGVFGRVIPADRRSWALGLGTAAGSLRQFLIVPLGQGFVDAFGWPTALLLLGATAGSTVIFALAFRGAETVSGGQEQGLAGCTVLLAPLAGARPMAVLR